MIIAITKFLLEKTFHCIYILPVMKKLKKIGYFDFSADFRAMKYNLINKIFQSTWLTILEMNRKDFKIEFSKLLRNIAEVEEIFVLHRRISLPSK